VVFVLEDAAGTIWAGNADTLYRFHAGRWESGGGWLGLPKGGAFDAYQDRAGTLWIATVRAGVRRAVPDEP